MAYFEDLSPYRYGSYPGKGAVNIGWLGDDREPFATGAVPIAVLEVLKDLVKAPVNEYLGFYTCELCPIPDYFIINDKASRKEWDQWETPRSGNGEIRLKGKNGIIYAAPVLIVHYIEEHQYLPPEEFLAAVMEGETLEY